MIWRRQYTPQTPSRIYISLCDQTPITIYYDALQQAVSIEVSKEVSNMNNLIRFTDGSSVVVCFSV